MTKHSPAFITTAFVFCVLGAYPASADSDCDNARSALSNAQNEFAEQSKEDDEIARNGAGDKCTDEYLAMVDRRADRDKIKDPLIQDFIQACQDDPQWGANARNMKAAMMLFGDSSEEAAKLRNDCNK